MGKLLLAAIVTAVGAGASGCARLHAREPAGSAPVGPPLEVPAPPPRVIVPVESQPIVAAPPPVEDAPARAPERTPTRPTPPRTDRAETPPPAPAPSSPTPPAAQPAARSPADPPEPRTLQTPNPAEAEQKTRVALANATRDLGRIDPRTLGADARAQYDIAKRFIEQADEALKAKNPVLAEQLAGKAATLAALLQKR